MKFVKTFEDFYSAEPMVKPVTKPTTTPIPTRRPSPIPTKAPSISPRPKATIENVMNRFIKLNSKK